MFSNIREGCQVIKDHSKMWNLHIWMVKRAKNEGFGHFLDLGLLDRLDIEDCVRNRCFPTLDKVARSWRIIQKLHKCCFKWLKVPKKMFLAVFLSLVCWIDLLLQMVKCFFSVVTLLYLVTEFCLEVSEVEHVVTRRYSVS